MPIIFSSQFFTRETPPTDAVESGGNLAAMYIAGFIIAGAVLISVAVWVGVQIYRKKHPKRRNDYLGSVFLSVRSIVKEDESYTEKHSSLTPTYKFDSQLIPPTRARFRDSLERKQIIEYHPQASNFNKSLHLTFPPSTRDHAARTPDHQSTSRSSSPSTLHPSRFSVMSTTSTLNDIMLDPSHPTRTVRQVFNPVLPDELTVTPGEQLMVLQSLEDGWCVVGRESSLLMPQPKPLSGGNSPRAITPTQVHGFEGGAGVGTRRSENLELGMVPAWCFLDPEQGLIVERPMRSTSLGAAVQMDSPHADRKDFISWSNL